MDLRHWNSSAALRLFLSKTSRRLPWREEPTGVMHSATWETAEQRGRGAQVQSRDPQLEPGVVPADAPLGKACKKLSPILMVTGDLVRGIPAIVADGYHRVCASYYTEENTDIPLKLADTPR